MSIQEQVKLWMAMIKEKDFCCTAYARCGYLLPSEVQVVLQHVDEILYLLSSYFQSTTLRILPVRDVAFKNLFHAAQCDLRAYEIGV
jgi:hypothetical protein